MSGFSFPIPGLNQTFTIPFVPSFEAGWGGGGKVKSAKRLKRQAAKKLKKLRRKQGR